MLQYFIWNKMDGQGIRRGIAPNIWSARATHMVLAATGSKDDRFNHSTICRLNILVIGLGQDNGFITKLFLFRLASMPYDVEWLIKKIFNTLSPMINSVPSIIISLCPAPTQQTYLHDGSRYLERILVGAMRRGEIEIIFYCQCTGSWLQAERRQIF